MIFYSLKMSNFFFSSVSGLRPIGIWFLTGCLMIYLMIIIGGITRLTGSGLSIVEWKVIMGTIPPLNEIQWNESFEKYKQFPQYAEKNMGMTLHEFKKIFFWEYIHRLWGRLLGLVFIIPFIYFLVKRQIEKPMIKKLIFVFLFGGLQGFVGWFMVQSGLEDKPWVSPYRLTLHLFLALLLYSYLFWQALKILKPVIVLPSKEESKMVKKCSYYILGFIVLQLFLGGLMSGMKAAIYYPTFPTMNGEILPSPIMISANWKWDNILNYNQNIFAPTLVQFCHRMNGYLIAVMIFILWLWLKSDNYTPSIKKASKGFLGLVILQILFGFATLWYSQSGKIPVLWGVIHQACAVAMLTFNILIIYLTQYSTIIPQNED